MIFLTRKAEFSSAHYYWNDAWSPEENQRVFGRCANRNGHGHNYTLEVTVSGEVDPTSGFVVDLKELKDILDREVVSVYDHRHLNLEVPSLRTQFRLLKILRLPSGNGWTTRFRMRSCTASVSTRCRIYLPTTMVNDEGPPLTPLSLQRIASPEHGGVRCRSKPRRLWQMQQPARPWA